MKQLRVLLVEDNADHVELIRRVFEDSQPQSRLESVPDGQSAIDYLFNQASFEDATRYPRPDLVLLDLRLPRVDGLEVLRRVKTESATRDIPVVILSTSAHDQDVAVAYQNHANSFLVKPAGYGGLTGLMQEIWKYWMEWNHYPVNRMSR